MSLGCSLQTEFIQGVEITGGLTSQMVFPQTEAKLPAHTDYQKALDYIGRDGCLDRYWSLVDFVFCEAFPVPWRHKALRYYKGEVHQLIDDPDITDETIRRYDWVLCDIVLETCLWALYERRRVSWEQMRDALVEALENANE